MTAHLPQLHSRLSDPNFEVSEVWLRINAFLDMRSKNTQRTYACVVQEWCRFLGAEAGSVRAAELFCQATDLHAMAYCKWLEGQPGQKPRLAATADQVSTERALAAPRKKRAVKRDGLQSTLANATIAKKFAALRRIYKMLIAANLVSGLNPFDTDRIPSPSARSGQKRPTEMIEFHQVREILAAPDASTPKGLRDLALLSVLFGGGLRRSEVVSLRLGDVRKTSEGTFFLHLRSTKARRDVDHAIPDWAAESVCRLIEQRLAEGASPGDYLFISYRGPAGATPTEHPLSDSGLYKLFKTHCRLAGVTTFATPHSARATAITKLLTDGHNHREVQEFSRHASVQMVEVYDKRRISVDHSPAKKLNF